VHFVRHDDKKSRMEYIDDASSMVAVVNTYINFIKISVVKNHFVVQIIFGGITL